MDLQYFLIS